MKATKITHKGTERIKLEFAYSNELITRVKQIPDARWSKTFGAWHIPYTKEAWQQLKTLVPDVEYDIPVVTNEQKINGQDDAIHELKAIAQGFEERQSIASQPEMLDRSEITIDVIGRRIVLKMPKNDVDVQFVSSLRYSNWNNKQFRWIIPNFNTNLQLLQDYFDSRLGRITMHETYEIETKPGIIQSVGKNELLLIKTANGRIKIVFGYNKQLSQYIKSLPMNRWDARNKWWSIPYTEKIYSDIIAIGNKLQLEVSLKVEEQLDVKVPRVSSKTAVDFRKCPDVMIQKLKELRYSNNTLKTYMNVFEEFSNYFRKYELSEIDETMVVQYIQFLVNERKVSTAYQNQTINAIKFYYEKVMGGTRQIYLIDRPRIEKTLPVVLSTQEVASIMKSVENVKHKTMLLLTYSSGLRISELLNMKVSDIDSKRKHIKIEQGKGNKDRFTVLSEKVLPLLREYYAEYKPTYYLFEGPNGKQYSSTSVNIILRTAVIKAKIMKRVTMHTLRHSFATHLLEQGTDIRYIQSLLGHEDPRTTQIYTHITTKGFEQIKSPLDSLEF